MGSPTFAPPRIEAERRPDGRLLLRSTVPLAEHPASVAHSFREHSEAHPDRLLVAESDEVAEAVNAVEEELGDSGRVLLRPSGTEQLVRVMVEAPTQEQADEVAGRLAGVVAAVG